MTTVIKNKQEIVIMKQAAQILVQALLLGESLAKPGVSTKDIDLAVEQFILSKGGTPGFKGHMGYPATICKAVNDEIVHGIPDDTPLQDGDILTIDCGVRIKGYNSDSALTVLVGNVEQSTIDFVNTTQQALYEAIKILKPGVKTGDIGSCVQKHIESKGYKIFKDLIGHGIGKGLWEQPQIPNYGKAGKGMALKAGMIICIEPIVGISTSQMLTLDDNWTIVTPDQSLACQWEHMILITEKGCEVLTLRPGEKIT